MNTKYSMLQCLLQPTTARERIQRLREDLAARRQTLAVASSITSYQYSNPSSQSVSPSSAPRSNTTLQRTPPQAPSTPVRPPVTTSRSSQPFPSTSPQSARSAFSRLTIAPSPSFSPPGAFPFSRPSPPTIKPVNNPDAILATQINEASFRLTELSDTIARARSGLVQELVEVFSVVEVGIYFKYSYYVCTSDHSAFRSVEDHR